MVRDNKILDEQELSRNMNWLIWLCICFVIVWLCVRTLVDAK